MADGISFTSGDWMGRAPDFPHRHMLPTMCDVPLKRRDSEQF